ncbi:hypothetical protein ABTN43_19310, partial [Acinetobacter baumannii]
ANGLPLPPTCKPHAPSWYRNLGAVPDMLERVTDYTGAWTQVTYESALGPHVLLNADGIRPHASDRVV